MYISAQISNQIGIDGCLEVATKRIWIFIEFLQKSKLSYRYHFSFTSSPPYLPWMILEKWLQCSKDMDRVVTFIYLETSMVATSLRPISLNPQSGKKSHSHTSMASSIFYWHGFIGKSSFHSSSSSSSSSPIHFPLASRFFHFLFIIIIRAPLHHRYTSSSSLVFLFIALIGVSSTLSLSTCSS